MSAFKNNSAPRQLGGSWEGKVKMNADFRSRPEFREETPMNALFGQDKDKTIVVYCGFVKCTRSHNGAMWAKRLGYTDVLRHPGGIFAWKGAEYLTESAKK